MNGHLTEQIAICDWRVISKIYWAVPVICLKTEAFKGYYCIWHKCYTLIQDRLKFNFHVNNSINLCLKETPMVITKENTQLNALYCHKYVDLLLKLLKIHKL